MALLGGLFKSKDARRFDKALRERRFTDALELARNRELGQERRRKAELYCDIQGFLRSSSVEELTLLVQAAKAKVAERDFAKEFASRSRSELPFFLAADCADRGLFADALNIANAIRNQGLRSLAVCRIAAAHRPDFERPVQLLKELSDAQRGVSDGLADISLALALQGGPRLPALTVAAQIPDATIKQMMENILTANPVPPAKLRLTIQGAKATHDLDTLVIVAFNRAFSGDREGGLQILREIEHLEVRRGFAEHLSYAYAWCEDIDAAVETAFLIPSDQEQADFLSILVKIFLGCDDAPKKINLSRLINQPLDRAILAGSALSELFVAGRVNEALTLYQEIKSDADPAAGGVSEVCQVMLEDLLEELAEIGDWSAIQIAV